MGGFVGGASRTGVGIYYALETESGLFSISKTTVRGFLTCYEIGDSAGSARPFNTSIRDSECSQCYNGVVINSVCENTVIDNLYVEGCEGGVAINDKGKYTTISNCLISLGLSFSLVMCFRNV